MPHIHSKYTKQAVSLLGQQIKLARKKRRWSEQALAQRAGIARATLRKIEGGDLTCAIGTAFEVAALVGLNLFDSDKESLARHRGRVEDKLAVLPKRIQTREVDDDF